MRSRPIHRLTIRQHLIGLALVVALPLLGVIAYGLVVAHHNDASAAKRTSSQVALGAASSVEEFLASTRAEMETIAARPLVQLADATRCDPFLADAFGLNQYAANIGVLNLQGTIVCSALRLPSATRRDQSDRGWFKQVRSRGRFTVSEPEIGRVSHRRVAVVAVPLAVHGVRTGYLAVPIDLVRFQTLLARLAEPSGSLVLVVDGTGLIVARSSQAWRFVATRVTSEQRRRLHEPPGAYRGADGVERMYARSRVLGTSWIVSSGMPTTVAYGASNRLSRRLAFVALALLVLALAAAVLAGRRIARPIELLARRARDISTGRRPGGAPSRAPREVAVAVEQIDEMIRALRYGEQQLGHVLESAGMGAWSLDATGHIWRSEGHDRLYGYSSPLPEWSIEIAIEHVVPSDRPVARAHLEALLETDHLEFEFRVAWADGSVHWMRVESDLERADDGTPFRATGTNADITERVHRNEVRTKLEEQLRQAQKMEAVGQLCGGIAHDFNNLLSVISGYSELALSRPDAADTTLRRDLLEIARAAERAARLTRQLLAFSSREMLQPVVFDLNDVVSDTESLLRRLLGEHIDILGNLAPDGCPINADRGQIEQILMNLALNARDAMPGGGTLTIETEPTRIGSVEARRRFDAPGGEYILLRVSDTGCGLAPDTLARAFEPFFTTKPAGEGTGLGLATVFGSVRQNGGYIELTSAVGVGTTFEIILPRTRQPIATIAARATPIRYEGTERILLVEDDAAVRALTEEILTARGYAVTVAEDGQEALTLSRTHRFDLLITDVVMPKMSGKDLAITLRRPRPGLPVIFMSGYAHDVTGRDGLDPADTFIQKPFPASELGRAVRVTLDAAPSDDDLPLAVTGRH